MMQLTPQKSAAIGAIADDERGEPNTRAIAKAKLEQLKHNHPEQFGQDRDRFFEEIAARVRRADEAAKRYATNPPNPRMRKTEEYEKWRFMDMSNWKLSVKGNYSITVAGLGYDIFLQTPLGLSALVYCVVAYGVGLFQLPLATHPR